MLSFRAALCKVGPLFLSLVLHRRFTFQLILYSHAEISCILTETSIVDPCNPSPCGPSSHCRASNGLAVCSCVTGFKGSPPSCRPECIVSSDCPRNRACSNQKCIDPCLGACGLSAQCSVINHNPVCSCFEQFIGDPFVQCIPQRKKNYFVVNDISRTTLFSQGRLIKISTPFSKRARCAGEPLPTITLRSKCSVPGDQQLTFLFLSLRIHRNAAELQAGVREQH